jgi:subtilisin family serine protease
MSDGRPAWSSPFNPGTLETIRPVLGPGLVTPEWAWGGSTGRGVRVAVLDSGVDGSHPAVGRVSGYLAVGDGPDGLVYDTEPHDDAFGHGTACAGIIRALAPECDLYSIKVLGPQLHGRGPTLLAGLAWAIEHGMQVCNLSLGSTKKEFFGALHELADLAYFHNVLLVTAANNMPVPSFPSTFASVISVAAHAEKNPELFYYNPRPPVEFGAPGIDLRVAWLGGGWITTTGNSFAAPHMSGVVARILAKHPGLVPFEVKSVLRALASNAAPRSSRRADG